MLNPTFTKDAVVKLEVASKPVRAFDGTVYSPGNSVIRSIFHVHVHVQYLTVNRNRWFEQHQSK